jgi:4-aminobutyrate aminotransferase / (S)-3-amino-2-methylpropionate transaminase / 5-aminovalerate transaminase
VDTIEKYRRYVSTGFVKKVQPIVVDRAEGATVWDEAGRPYVDLFSGISVVNAGHCNPDVVAAATAQMRRLVHCNSYLYHNKPTADFAEALAGIMPSPDLHVSFFANSGAEAVEGAMRVAKQFTGKTEFLALDMSFHGRTVGTLSVTGNWARKKRGGPYLPGVAFAPAPYAYRSPFGPDPEAVSKACAEEVERVIDCHTSGSVAAFLAEPVMGEGGIIVPPASYFRRVKEVLDRRGILFICDEVQSGFGRTGKMLAIEHYGVVPDIVVTAKGIADGFPLSAFTMREEIAKAFTPGDHLSTFGGNPVCCAAALANLRFFEREKLADQAAAKGKRLLEGLARLAASHERIGDVRGLGLMVGVELVSDRAGKTPDAATAVALQDRLLEAGFIVGLGGFHGNVLRIQPPLVISEEDLERAVAALDRALADAR